MQNDIAIRRISLAVFGCFSALALWALVDFDPVMDALGQRGLLIASVFSMVFFGATLAMTGPITLGRALLNAAPLAVLAAGLTFWSSFRFDPPQGLDKLGFDFLALILIASIPLPFLIGREEGQGI